MFEKKLINRNKLVLASLFLPLFYLLLSTSNVSASEYIEGFFVYKKAQGVTVYKANCPEWACVPDYVMKIDLADGARIKSIYREPYGDIHTYSPRSQTVPNRRIANHWEAAKNETDAFAVFNFAFHDGRGNLSLPLKVGENLISYGYALNAPANGGEYPDKYKILRFDNYANKAMVVPYYKWKSNLYESDMWLNNVSLNAGEEIVGGFNVDVCKSCEEGLPRIFMGVANDIIYLYASEKATNEQAIAVLGQFGVHENDIIQGDGGGSAQLVVRNPNDSTYIEVSNNETITVENGEALIRGRQWQGKGARWVPHAFAVYAPDIMYVVEEKVEVQQSFASVEDVASMTDRMLGSRQSIEGTRFNRPIRFLKPLYFLWH